jgi:hypothetical protein
MIWVLVKADYKKTKDNSSTRGRSHPDSIFDDFLLRKNNKIISRRQLFASAFANARNL